MEREIEEHSKSGKSLKPEVEADMGVEVRCAEGLQQLCQTKAMITAIIKVLLWYTTDNLHICETH